MFPAGCLDGFRGHSFIIGGHRSLSLVELPLSWAFGAV